MFVILSKILPPFIYPVGLTCLALGFALLLYRHPRISRALVLFSLVLLWLAGNRLFSYQLTRSLEWQYLPMNEYPPCDVIVVLGGGTLSANSPRSMPEVNGAGDRLFYAAKLFQEGKADKVLLSGGVIDWYTPDEGPAHDMAILIELLGVPQSALILENESRNTYENAQKSWEILAPQGKKRILLVTSALHMPRSVKVFTAQGFEVVPAPTDFTVTQAGWQKMITLNPMNIILNLIPSAENLALTTRSLKEYIGMQAYNLLGD
ncbi:MAG: YdcF family protein [Chloroflexota bacterium]